MVSFLSSMGQRRKMLLPEQINSNRKNTTPEKSSEFLYFALADSCYSFDLRWLPRANMLKVETLA